LVKQASEIEGNDNTLAYCKQKGHFRFLAASNEVLSIMVPHISVIGSGGVPPVPQTILMSWESGYIQPLAVILKILSPCLGERGQS
jgi:hypothetical protein